MYSISSILKTSSFGTCVYTVYGIYVFWLNLFRSHESRLELSVRMPSEEVSTVMGVPPNWMVYKGKFHENGWFMGSPILGTPHIYNSLYLHIVRHTCYIILYHVICYTCQFSRVRDIRELQLRKLNWLRLKSQDLVLADSLQPTLYPTEHYSDEKSRNMGWIKCPKAKQQKEHVLGLFFNLCRVSSLLFKQV